jgi:hypothetical protein
MGPDKRIILPHYFVQDLISQRQQEVIDKGMPENINNFELSRTALKHDKLGVFDQGMEELPV